MTLTDNQQQQHCSKRFSVILLRDVLVGSLMVIFIYAFSVQFNDSSGIVLWSLFYAFHALLCALSLISYHFDSMKEKSKVLLLPISLILIVWSLIQIIVVAIQLSKADDDKEEGGDNPDATEREEKMFELSGTILGLVVASAHAFYFTKCNDLNHRQEVDEESAMHSTGAFTPSNSNANWHTATLKTSNCTEFVD